LVISNHTTIIAFTSIICISKRLSSVEIEVLIC
jgi:hypothetical protein